MRLVALKREIFIAKRKQVVDSGIEFHARHSPRLARKLQTRLVDVVEIEMRIAQRMDELAWPIAGDLCNHHRQQSVGGDIEWNSQEYVGGALIKLARQPAAGDIELKQAMAWRQRHLVH